VLALGLQCCQSGWVGLAGLTSFPPPHLHRVAQYAEDNKMGSPNLALVFGPTLTRAPDDKDPRQLHNDVPSINVLIQLCIDYHEYIFGEEDEEEAAREGSMSPPQHTESPLLEKLEDAVLQEPRESPTPPPLSSTPQVQANWLLSSFVLTLGPTKLAGQWGLETRLIQFVL